MTETLKALRRRGFRLGIVTNGETEFQTRHVDALGFGPLVDIVLVSQAEGSRKPEAASFLRAAKRLGVEPAHWLLVGDNPTVDILGAHAAGMKTVWFKSEMAWPEGIVPMPGTSINALPELLCLIGSSPEPDA
jgi:putative hydrolase of the HAD superfamily